MFREDRGGSSATTPVLRTRSRLASPSAPRVAPFLPRALRGAGAGRPPGELGPYAPLPKRPPLGYAAQHGRSVAQPGRALSSGGRGRRFESSHSDQIFAGKFCRHEVVLPGFAEPWSAEPHVGWPCMFARTARRLVSWSQGVSWGTALRLAMEQGVRDRQDTLVGRLLREGRKAVIRLGGTEAWETCET